MTISEVLLQSLQALTNAVGGRRSVLFAYDELAPGFSVAAVCGEPSDGEVDGVVRAPDDLLTEVLATRRVDRRTIEERHIRAVPVLGKVGGGEPALFVPLVADIELGVAVIWGGELVRNVAGARAEWVSRVASTAAENLRRLRPDVDHWCRFRRILEVDPGGIAVVEGTDYTVSYANASLRSSLGLNGTPLLGRSARHSLSPVLGPLLLEALEQVRAAGGTFHAGRVEVRDQYGARHYELHLVAERGGDGATFVILWDRSDAVSMRLALEQSVRELADSQSMLSAVLDATNNGIMLVGTNGTVLYANRRLGELFGLDTGELVGADETAVADRLRERAREPAPSPGRYGASTDRVTARDTDRIEVQYPVHRILDRYRGPVHKRDDTLLGEIEVYTDVTEVEQLQRNKDDFLSVVSHELRTPVTSIKGFAQLLKRRAGHEKFEASTVRMFAIIERQATRMQELIDSLLDLSRLDLGRLPLERHRLDLTALVRVAVESIGMTDESRHIKLELPDEPTWVRGDERRLEQVVTNLLLNALRYSPGGEEVSVTLSLDTDVRLAVRDRGIGIPLDAQARIFERFFRGAGMTDLTGLGIGLYISKTIVEEHGGNITVTSTPGSGSTFTVILPRLQVTGEDG